MDALTTEGYAGRRQAATLEQQGLTATGLGLPYRHGRRNNRGLCKQTAGGHFKQFRGLKAGKRQA